MGDVDLAPALARLLDCVERLDPDGRGRDQPVTDEEIDEAVAQARKALAGAHWHAPVTPLRLGLEQIERPQMSKVPQIGPVQFAIFVEELARGRSKTSAAFKSRHVCEGLALPALNPRLVVKHWHATAEAAAADVRQKRDRAYCRRIADLVAMGEAAGYPRQIERPA